MWWCALSVKTFSLLKSKNKALKRNSAVMSANPLQLLKSAYNFDLFVPPSFPYSTAVLYVILHMWKTRTESDLSYRKGVFFLSSVVRWKSGWGIVGFRMEGRSSILCLIYIIYVYIFLFSAYPESSRFLRRKRQHSLPLTIPLYILKPRNEEGIR